MADWTQEERENAASELLSKIAAYGSVMRTATILQCEVTALREALQQIDRALGSADVYAAHLMVREILHGVQKAGTKQ